MRWILQSVKDMLIALKICFHEQAKQFNQLSTQDAFVPLEICQSGCIATKTEELKYLYNQIRIRF